MHRLLTLEELARESDAPPELVAEMVAIGAFASEPDGRFDARHAATVRTVRAILDAGVGMDDLAWAISGGQAAFEAIARHYATPAARSARTYADLRAELADASDHLPAMYAALGLPEPEPDDHLREDEEAIVRELVSSWHAVDHSGEALTRAARIAGDSLRRATEAWLDLWDATARPTVATQGSPTERAPDGRLLPRRGSEDGSVVMAELTRRLIPWLHERMLEESLNRRIIAGVERLLARANRLPMRTARPPAVAFVDLSGFTSLTIAAGDEAAAVAAARLQELAERACRAQGGRVVKLLGDGVLLRFVDAASALSATLELVEAVSRADLPAAHAGIAAGRVIVRDGDVFGRTVNLAARMAQEAGPGEVLVEEGVVVALPRGTARFEPVGRVELRGVPDPVAIWRAAPAISGRPRG